MSSRPLPPARSLSPRAEPSRAVVSPVHRESHRHLLWQAHSAWCRTGPGFDAVVVPAFRPAGGLRHAATVAALAGARLVLLCSGRVRAREAAQVARLAAPEVPVVACDLAPGYRIPQTSMRTDDHPQGRTHRLERRHDANVKRNVGLILARLMGWQRVLLLNDDVRGVGRLELDRTAGLLHDPYRAYSAAGWAFPSFPDNSVVCHGRRLGGAFQDTFISDAMLGLRCLDALPFFPAVYNEDWLFLLPLILSGQLAYVGDLWQLPYDPFLDPNRARFEEFGDLLGEGLMEVLHRGLPLDVARDPAFWAERLDARRRLLDVTESRLASARDGDPITRWRTAGARSRALRSLAAARGTHREGWPESLAEWIQAWQADLRQWTPFLRCLPVVDSMDGALALLGLRDEARAGHRSRVGFR